MEQVNKPSTYVITVMWLQVVSLIPLTFFCVDLLVDARTWMSTLVLSLTALAVVAFGALGVLTAILILRGRWWAWWIELCYTVLPVSVAIDAVASFKGFSAVTKPETFVDVVGEAANLAIVPLILVTPFCCFLMASRWRKRELASRIRTENGQS
jgi:hypothetical protein